jgi:DNA mismatch endonuclease, patch repair protein
LTNCNVADVFTKRKRSEIMGRVRDRGNRSTELRFIDILRAARITGWRRRAPLFGRPDFVFPEARLAVFIDGCFWHSCPTHGTIPETNRDFWSAKLRRNTVRDLRVGRHLRRLGWRTLRIWQHELRHPDAVTSRVRRRLSSCEQNPRP